MLVVFLFLQNWRATLIPILAVPVSLIGTFAGMYLLGFSINTADAVRHGAGDRHRRRRRDRRAGERRAHHARRRHCRRARPRSRRCRRSAGPVIAIVLVLCAVFMPVAFLGGLAGELYRQFAVTIAVSVVISGFVALTLTPALCALILLKPAHGEPAGFFALFNRGFALADGPLSSAAWRFMLRHAVHRRWRSSRRCSASPGCCSSAMPTASCRTRTRATSSWSRAAARRVARAHARRHAQVTEARPRRIPPIANDRHVHRLRLLSAALSRPTPAMIFVPLKHWSERTTRRQTRAIVATCSRRTLSANQGRRRHRLQPAADPGLGTTGGFEFYIQDRDRRAAERARRR